MSEKNDRQSSTSGMNVTPMVIGNGIKNDGPLEPNPEVDIPDDPRAALRRDLVRIHGQDSVLRVDPDLCVHGNHPADGCAICATKDRNDPN